MEDAARGVLADPDRPGGKAGRALAEGVAARPDVPVSANDPGVRRGKAVATNPQAPAHHASGLASGSNNDCNAGVGDAGRGGTCGRVTYCVGAGCETVEPRANTGFARSASMLNMVIEMGGEEFDRGSLRFFMGERRTCTIKWGGLANCCKNSGLLVGLGGCSASERELAGERNAGNTHYLGRYLLQEGPRGVRAPQARLVRVRLQARAHPAPAGKAAARHRLGKLPGPHGRRDRAHRLRPARPLRVHGKPRGRIEGAFDLASRGGRHAGDHDGPHPRFLREKPVSRCTGRFAAIGFAWALLGVQLPASAAEWRPWCGEPGAASPLGWHFYCDREDDAAEEAPASDSPASGTAPGSAAARIQEMRLRLGGSPGRRRARSETGEGDGLSAASTGDAAEGRRLLRRLPSRGLGHPRSGLHAQTPGGSAR